MVQITIENSYGKLTSHEGKLPKARLQWRGAGIEIFTKGPLTGTLYESAANLAMNICEDRHIPISSLRRAK